LALNRKENRMSLPSRRTFLKTALAAAASLFLPRFVLARAKPTSFWFLHATTGDSWPVEDPVAWALANARQPILERASAGLLKLTPADDQRIIRLVVRRCKLNLLEIGPGRVVVHYWGQQGQADLHPFFKRHGLARNDVRVTLIDRKRETTTAQTGDDLLYGERPAEEFPLRVYLKKWRRRAIEEPDDWTAAPHTWSGFAWEGVEPNRIPWAALKCAWRLTAPMICPNCDEPTILTNFGLPQCGMFNREARFIHACGQCHRWFQDYSIDRFDVMTWMVSHLDAEVLPDSIMWMGKPVKWQPPGVS
jgi:hypothetical protein